MLNQTAALIVLFLASAAAYGGDKRSMPVASPAPSAAAPGTTVNTADEKNKCEEEWKKYRKSQACFAPYRLVNGGIKAEAFKHCTEVKQPELCE